MRPILILALVATVGACDAPPPDAPAGEADAPVIISLLDDGTVILDDEEITPDKLTEALEGMETPGAVTVKAERDVTAGTVDEVQKALVAAGITSVRFLSSP